MHKQALDESLVDYLNNTSNAPQLKIKRFSEIYGTESYRFIESEGKCKFDPALTWEEYIVKNKKLPTTSSGYSAPQFGPVKHPTPTEAADYLQIKTNGVAPVPNINNPAARWSDCKLRITVLNTELENDVFFSFSGKTNFNKYVEPCCRTHPEFGKGGGIQFECPGEINIQSLEKWNGTDWIKIF